VSCVEGDPYISCIDWDYSDIQLWGSGATSKQCVY